jgi:hypothetical protein
VEEDSAVVEGRGIVGPHSQSLVVARQRLTEPLQLVEEDSAVVEGIRVIRPNITVVSFCWRICLISESMGHHDSEIMDDGSID